MLINVVALATSLRRHPKRSGAETRRQASCERKAVVVVKLLITDKHKLLPLVSCLPLFALVVLVYLTR